MSEVKKIMELFESGKITKEEALKELDIEFYWYDTTERKNIHNSILTGAKYEEALRRNQVKCDFIQEKMEMLKAM